MLLDWTQKKQSPGGPVQTSTLTLSGQTRSRRPVLRITGIPPVAESWAHKNT